MKSAANERRAALKLQYFGEDDTWTAEKEKGWFQAPRILPLIMELLSRKDLSDNKNPSTVYVELLSRNMGGGLIEMAAEASHAYAAGYVGSRAIRTWQERMRVLEDLGFIKTVQIDNRRYAYVAMIHPTVAIQRLRDKGKIDDTWYNTYRSRQIEVGEQSFEERYNASSKVKPFKSIPEKKNAAA